MRIFGNIPRQLTVPKVSLPPLPRMKVKRLYEDDTWVIDLVDGNIRVSYFEDCHFVDEMMITKDSFKE